jgi:Na+-translocating ferredoxin:NAD+ oxidoreductase RNF subunit RnfB
MSDIIFPVLVIGGLGIILGLGLGAAGQIFKVHVDERLAQLMEIMPGANCGGCGFAGCDAFARAVSGGQAKASGCPLGGAALAKHVAKIMGEEVGDTTRMTAVIRCNGTSELAADRYEYFGMQDCAAADTVAGGGSKECSFGCVGLSSCARVCPVNAIKMEEGIAKVDKERCVACTLCVAKCPRGIIQMQPYDSNTRVMCCSKDNGRTVRGYCKVGCIACGICVKQCPEGALRLEDNFAVIDYKKCTDCGVCSAKCHMKTIKG